MENSSAIGSHLKSKGLNKNDFFKIKSLGKKFQEPSGNSGISAKEEQEKGFIANNELNYTLTQAEAESLLEPLYIESAELLTDFEIYQDLVDEFQDPTISDIILSALLVTNEYSSQAISGVTEHELRHCLLDALGLGGPSFGAIIWGNSPSTVKNIVLSVSKFAARHLGAIGLAYSLWVFADCLFEASEN